jgi:hypothetical protein
METPVCWHRERYVPPKSMASKDLVKFDPSIPDFERKYTHECISQMMKLGRENEFFVTYNHPVWSCEDFSDYIGYENMHAMEIMNNTCIRMGLPEYNDKIYDDILRSGKRIFCTATDDGHGKGSMCGCYIVVKAEKLEYKTVTDAMLKGNFYSSEGPEIRSLYIEDGKLTVETSDVAQICITTGSRVAKRFLADDMSTINSATYEIPLEKNPYYIRVTVIDSKGKRAYSNAYFLDEIL